jgi:hypothetical protein
MQLLFFKQALISGSLKIFFNAVKVTKVRTGRAAFSKKPAKSILPYPGRAGILKVNKRENRVGKPDIRKDGVYDRVC